jgi:hypothetical protein
VPPDFRQKLVSPTDVDTASHRMEQLYHNRDMLKEYVLTDWARQMYGERKCFWLMADEL